MRRVLVLTAVVFYFAASASAQSPKTLAKAPAPKAATTSVASPAAAAARASFARLPLSFEENVGQTDGRVKYTSRGAGYSLFLTNDEAVIALGGGSPDSNCTGAARKFHSECVNVSNSRQETAALWLKFLGANPSAQVVAADPLPGRINYYIGNNPSKWRTGVRQFGRVNYQEIYPGVDLTYYGNQEQLESDFVVAPGSNPRSVELEVTGAQDMRLDAQGNLVLATRAGNVQLLRPVVYQMIGGARHDVTGRYVLRGGNRIGFAVGPYNRHQTLIIDPVLVYSTYLGGSSLAGGDEALSIAIDAAGHAYVTGQGESSDFPGTDSNGPPTEFLPLFAFVTELDQTGSSGSPGKLVYSTVLSGSDADTTGNGISLDGAGNAYVAGTTSASDLPMVNPFQATFGDPQQSGFIASLSTTGTLNYSTYLGGRNADDNTQLNAIFADSTGNTYVTGSTNSQNFPTISSLPLSLNLQFNFGTNVIVAKLNPSGQALYSTYLNGTGSGTDSGQAIVADASGNAYVTGQTSATAFPLQTSPLPFQGALSGSANVFVTKLAFSGSSLSVANSTYVGGSGSDEGLGIAIDSASPPNVYITGQTTSPGFGATSFPTKNPISGTFTSGPYSGGTYGGGTNNPTDAFVTELNGTFSALVFSSYLGGSGADVGNGIGLDGSGNVYVAGSTTSANFPMNLPLQIALGSSTATNIFLAKLPGAGNSLTYSTYLGGTGSDVANGVAVDSTGNAYIAGKTTSPNFPLMSGGASGTSPFQGQLGTSVGNAFIAKVSPTAATGLTLFPSAYNFHDVGVGASATEIVTLSNNTASAITISSFAFGGANSGDFSLTAASPSPCSTTLPFNVAAGASCLLTIQFAPQDQDGRSGTFTVNGTLTMNLSGSGGAPQVSLNTTSITFFPNPDPLNVLASAGVTVTNTGGGTLRVGSAQISASTPATAALFSVPTSQSSCLNGPVAPGGSCSITVNFLPTSAGTFNATLLINDNAAGSPQTLAMTGVGAQEVVVQPTSLELGEQVVNSTSTENANEASLVNGSGETINITVTPGTGPDQGDFHLFSFNGLTSCATVGALAAGGSCELAVYFQPTAASATDGRTGSYTIGWAGTSVPSVVPGSQVVNVMGTGVTGISLLTNSITGPNEFVGFTEGSAGLEILFNGTANPITVAIALSGNNPGDFTAKLDPNCAPGGVVPANTYCRVELSFTPSAIGLRTATATFNYTGVSNGQLLLSLSGTGIPGPVIISTNSSGFEEQIFSFDFGSEIISTTTPEKVFQVRNVATVPLTIQSVTPPANADFKFTPDTTCAAGTLAGGASCFIGVTFTPSTTSKETTTFVVTDAYSQSNGVDSSSPHTITLTGTGEAAAITVSVSSGGTQLLDFGNVPLNPTTAPQGAIYLTNGGNTSTTIKWPVPPNPTAAPQLLSAGPGLTLVTSGQDATTCTQNMPVLPQGGNCLIGVQFNPTAAGKQTATVTFTDSVSGVTHTVNIQGNGVTQGLLSWSAAAPATTFTSLTFKQVQGTTSSAQTATLTNLGSGSMTITALPVFLSNGTSASTFAILPSSTCTLGAIVAAGSNCVLNVTFVAPATAGNSSEELEVQANLGNNVTSTVFLEISGTSLAGGFALSPAPPIVFGAVAVGSTATSAEYTLTNENATSVTIGALSVPAGYSLTFDDCSGQVLTSTGECFFEISLTPNAAGSFNGNLNIPFTGGSGSSPFTVALQGSGTAAVVANPNPLVFQAFLNFQSSESVTIENGSSSAATITAVSGFSGAGAAGYSIPAFGDGCIFGGVGTVLSASGGQCSITFDFQSATAGSFSASFTVSYSINGTAQTPITVNLTANIPSAQAVITTPTPPNPLVFPSQTVNTQSQPMNVVLSNAALATTALSVSNLQISGNDFALASANNCFSVNAGQSCTISIIFTPSVSGTRNGTLTITDNSTTTTQTVNLQGTGVAGSVTVSPSTLAFPTTNVGSSVTIGAVLTNNTGSAVTFTGVNFTGPYAIDTGANSCVNSAKVGAVTGTCVVYIKFTPTGSANAGTATVNFTGGSFVVTLSGTGTNPNVNVSPTSLTFSNQTVGTTSGSQTVTLNNPTGSSATVSGSAPTITGTNPGDFALVNNNCTGKTVAANSSCTIGVTFTPGASGGTNRTATLTISDSSPAASFPVSLSGTAVEPVASLNSNSMTFGNSNVGVTTGQQTVTVTNTGNAALNISNIALGGTNAGDFAIVAPSSGTQCTNTTSLAASASCVIAATFDPTAANSRTATITITDNATPTSQVINLSGTGTTPGVGFNPTSITFSAQLIKTTSVQSTTVLTNSGTGSLTINAGGVILTGTNAGDFALVTPSGVGITNCVSASAVVLSAGGTCTIAVTFTPSATGSRTASVSVSDNASGSPQTVALSGTGTAPGVTLNPTTTVAFGNEIVTVTSAQQTVTLTNSGTASLTLATVALSGTNVGNFAVVSGPGTTCTAGAVIGFTAPGNTCTVQLTFTPSATGARSATLTFTDNAGGTAGTQQTLSLTGTGQAAPTATLSTATVNFGNQEVGTTSTPATTVTVTNNGDASLTITALALDASGNPGDFVLTAGATNPCSVTGSTTVVGHANCTLNVAFKPSAINGRTATVDLTDNGDATGAAGAKQTVGLSGTGTAPAAQVASTLGFGNQPINQTATMGLTLTNNGTAALNLAATNAVAIAGTNANLFGIGSGTTCTNGASVPAGGGSCVINVTFAPTAVGSFGPATLTITDDSGAAAGTKQTVSLTGSGVTASVNFSPSPVNFTPNQNVGSTSSNVTVTLTNSGGLAVQLAASNAVAISGTNAGDFKIVGAGTTCINSATVGASGGNCLVILNFTPSATGARTATLTVTDNANPTAQTLTLNGTGIAPVASAPASLSFGNEIVSVASAQQTVTLTNTGSATLTLSTVALGGTNPGDFAIVPGAGTTCTNGAAIGFTAPNNTCTVAITFTPGGTGARSATLTFTDNSNDVSGSTQTVNLSGAGQAAPTATLSTATVNFGNQEVGTTSTPATTVTVTNNGDASLTITALALDASGNPGDFVLTAGATNPCSVTGSTTVVGHSNCTFNVAFKPTAINGRSATVDLTDNGDATGAAGAKQTVGLSGTGTAPAAVVASTLGFGNQPISQTATQTVTLTNNGTAALNLAAANAVAIAGTNANLFGIGSGTTCTNGASVPAGGGSCVINVTFAPTAVGSFGPATLTITDDSGAVAGTKQTVSLSGSGVTSTVNFNPGSLAFGNQRVGSPSAQMTAVLTNSATSSLSISSVTLTGANPGDFALVLPNGPGAADCTTVGSVASQGTCRVAVTFTPTATGSRTATVSVSDNAVGSPHTFTVSGTGTASAASLSSNSLTFASQIQTTTSAVQTITVTNTGTASLNISTVVLGGTNPADFAIVSGAQTTCVASASIGFTAPNNTCTIAVTFTPATANPFSATITITDDANPATQVVNASGTGVTPPTATPAPTSLTFAGQPTTTTSVAQTVTLTNSGGAPLTVTSITFTGTNPGDFAFASPATTCPIGAGGGTVAAGSNCVLSVTFSPAAIGARSASISIVVTGIANPAPVTLSGNGTAPDLAITKTPVGTFEAGVNGSYTIKLTNNGTAATQHQITVTDTLPAGLGFVSGTGTGWTCSSGAPPNAQTVTCTNAGPIAVSASSTITLTVSVASAAFPSVTNTATVADAGDSGTNDKSASAPTTVTAPDVTLTKSHTGDFVVGSNGVYTFKVTNNGNGPTTGNIVVTDTLPTGLAFVSNTGTGWACVAGTQTPPVTTCTYTGAALAAAGGSSTFTMTVSAAPGAFPSVTNSATVSDPNDSKTTDKSVTDAVTNIDNAVPTETSFTPSTGLIIGTGLTSQQITLTGTGFNSSTQVTIAGGSPITGTANAAGTSLTLTVPASALATPGSVTITVTNPKNPNSNLGGGAAPSTLSFPLVGVTAAQDASTTGTITVTAGTPATVKIDYTTSPANSPLPASLTITCAFPQSLTGATCQAGTPTIAAGATSGSSTITINAIPAKSNGSSTPAPGPGGRGPWTTYSLWMLAAVLLAMLGMWASARQRMLPLRRAPAYLGLVLLVLAAGALVGCTTAKSGPTPTPVGPSTMTVTATAQDGTTVTTTVNITIAN